MRRTAILVATALSATGVIVFVSHDFTGASSSDDQSLAAADSTIACPVLTDKLSNIPDTARQKVDEAQAAMDVQISQSLDRLVRSQNGSTGDTDELILADLTRQRQQSLAQLSGAFAGASSGPADLSAMANCKMMPSGDGVDQSVASLKGKGKGRGAAGNGQKGGLSRRDFVDITAVQPNNNQADNNSGGVVTIDCGTNENQHLNPGNFIVAPGVQNGAHHMHDYVGNKSTDGFSTNQSLAAAGTTCKDGDKSAYIWPVTRQLDGSREFDANAPGGGQDKNVGKILQPTSVTLTMEGSSAGPVTAMPPFLRMVTGDAKAFTSDAGGGGKGKNAVKNEAAKVGNNRGGKNAGADNRGGRTGNNRNGNGQGNNGQGNNGQGNNGQDNKDNAAQADDVDNANASWSCTGFENRQLKDKYPICPQGSQVVRTLDFPSCWDGKNTDSANHRTHVVFPDDNGTCDNGFQLIPKLTMRLTYDVPQNAFFAVDSFPEQLHKAVTDHADFANVMPGNLMAQAVDCINSGRTCDF